MSDTPHAPEPKENSKCILVLPTTHHTLLAEQALQSANIRYLPIPKPERATSDCGMAIQIEYDSLSQAAATLKEMDVKFFLKTVDDEIEPIDTGDIPKGDRR